MKILRKFLAGCVVAIVATASGVLVAQADATPTVYDLCWSSVGHHV